VSEAGGAAVVVEHVAKAFEGGRIVALQDVSLTIEPGEFVALTGPSGGGKSTLLNLIGALDVLDSGAIRVAGVSVADLRDPSAYRATTVGFVFQFHNLIATLTAIENVEIAMLGHGQGRRRREQKARELLGEVGLEERLGNYPATLSGGERQRVAIARALANDPLLLLADEPTGALDSETGEQIITLLRRVREQRGMTILMVTNDLGVAERADRMLRMRDGRVEAVSRAGAPRSA
jgi:putative ABC transport system ATP-binding protein